MRSSLSSGVYRALEAAVQFHLDLLLLQKYCLLLNEVDT